MKSLLLWTVVVLVTIVVAEEEEHNDDELISNFLHNDDHIHNKEWASWMRGWICPLVAFGNTLSPASEASVA